MNKKFIISLALILITSCCVYSAETVDTSALDKDTIYYPNANIKSAVAKYKKGNYSGCLQELFSLTKKHPENAEAYYYMAIIYTHLDMKTEAIEAYEKVISLKPNTSLAQYATKGKDCLTGGPTCVAEKVTPDNADSSANKVLSEEEKLDRFINAPYGNGLSPELDKELKQKQLNNFQKTINQKKNLETDDIERLKNFDEKSDADNETVKIAQVSDEDVLQAVKTLKEAGLNVTVQSQNPYAYQSPEMMEMSMLLGNTNNNNNGMNILPMLMTKAENGENIDPRLMQAVMMNSMLPDFTFNNDNNRY